mmetsp:Transcript_12036/g.39593  ORF Transcript_12036/g.39593 Transcript_12036/m.39593 type:complete len:205 (-) Transcript_12036:519-1133(-)
MRMAALERTSSSACCCSLSSAWRRSSASLTSRSASSCWYFSSSSLSRTRSRWWSSLRRSSSLSLSCVSVSWRCIHRSTSSCISFCLAPRKVADELCAWRSSCSCKSSSSFCFCKPPSVWPNTRPRQSAVAPNSFSLKSSSDPRWLFVSFKSSLSASSSFFFSVTAFSASSFSSFKSCFSSRTAMVVACSRCSIFSRVLCVCSSS